MLTKLNISHQILLFGASCITAEADVSNVKNLLSQNPDWPSILPVALAQGIAPMLFKNMTFFKLDENVPNDVMAKLQAAYYKTYSKNVLAAEKLTSLLHQFNKAGIDTMLLKGIASAEYIYKDPGLRPMGDIDIMVSNKNLLRAEQMLFDNGFVNDRPYKSYKLRILNIHNHLNAFIGFGIKIELHRDLSSVHHIHRMTVQYVWDNCTQVSFQNERAFIPDTETNLEYLAIHAIQHFQKRNIRLNSFSDIDTLIKNNVSQINWDKLIASAAAHGTSIPVCNALRIGKDFFKTPVPEDVISSYCTGNNNLEADFIHLLNNQPEKIKFKTPSNYFKKIREIDSVSNRFRYLFAELFPSKDYMIFTYKPRFENLYLFYYLLQFFRPPLKTIRNIFLIIKRRF